MTVGAGLPPLFACRRMASGQARLAGQPAHDRSTKQRALLPGRNASARPPGGCQYEKRGEARTSSTRRTPKANSPRLDSEPGKASLRILMCSSCSTAEVVPWCGSHPDCGHADCADALVRFAASHRLDDRRFHGQVNMVIIEKHLWERYAGK